ncbi:MAG: hypothetical protein WC794_04525 [Candidatus Doudnabacteria bacterium]|jgi:hypothetical protein
MTQKKPFAIILASIMIFFGQFAPQTLQPVFAAVTTPVAPTVNVSSDSATGASIALPIFTLTEGVAGDISVGTLTWVLPSGFAFDTTSIANVVYSGSGLTGSDTVSFLDNSHFSLNINSTSTVAGGITIGSVTPLKIKATNGTPLAASGQITLSAGAVAGITATTSFASLSQIPGVANKLKFTIQPQTTSQINTSLANFQVSVQDQFGNLVNTDNGRAVSLVPVLVGSSTLGTLSGSTVINTTAGASTFTGISYNQIGTIQLRADSTSLTSDLSNNIVFSATPTPTPTTTPTNLPNGVLVKFPGDPTIYMVVNGSLRPFTSAAIFHARGKKFQDIKEITKDWLKQLRIGKPVGHSDDDDIETPPITITLPAPTNLSSSTLASLNGLPDGTVVKVAGNPTVYIVTNGQLQPIPSLNVFRSWHKRFEDIKEIPASVLNTLPLGSPATFADGTLLKGPGHTIYVVKNGQLYGIPSMSVLAKNGWSLNNLLQVQSQDLNSLNTGGIED